jgi:EamA domain-containing membrane protein RarD
MMVIGILSVVSGQAVDILTQVQDVHPNRTVGIVLAIFGAISLVTGQIIKAMSTAHYVKVRTDLKIASQQAQTAAVYAQSPLAAALAQQILAQYTQAQQSPGAIPFPPPLQGPVGAQGPACPMGAQSAGAQSEQ